MPIEHKNITDPNIHEPLGVATADSGDMYVANGAGSGTWQKSSMNAHGEMTVTNNTTATVITAAADATLNTDTDYVKITAGWGAPHAHGVTFNVDELVAPVNGHYEVAFWSSIKVPSINNFIGIKYAVDDSTPYSLQKIVSQSVSANDYKNLSGHGGIDLTTGQTVSVYIAGTKTDNLVIEEAGVSLRLLHEQ